MAAFLANENVPFEAIAAARAEGYHLDWIKELAAGADDVEVMQRSLAGNAVLVTFDKDFGQLVFQQGVLASSGIILLRPRLRSPAYLARFLVSVLSQQLRWERHFTVATEGRIRIIPLR